MSVALSQPTLASQPSPSFCNGRKYTEVEQAMLWTLLQQEPRCTSRDLLARATQHQVWPRVTLRQINRWRAKWDMSRGKGRPRRATTDVSMRGGSAVVDITPRLSFVGCICLLAGSINERPLHRWWPGSKRLSATIKVAIRTKTLPCCITAMPPLGVALGGVPQFT